MKQKGIFELLALDDSMGDDNPEFISLISSEEEEEMNKKQEETEECPVCLENLPKFSNQFTRFTCCGKGVHTHCTKDRHHPVIYI